jgi:hypothetical protein
VGGILKQSLERLDNVRREAGESLLVLLRTAPPKHRSEDLWRLYGETRLKDLFLWYGFCARGVTLHKSPPVNAKALAGMMASGYIQEPCNYSQ